MAITFDNSTTIHKIIRSLQGVFTSTTPAYEFEYFPENVAAGDYIVFGLNNQPWHDLTLQVLTPVVASTWTVVWEYLGMDGVWNTLTYTDGTNGFKTAGVNTIAFTVPDNWGCLMQLMQSGTYNWVCPIRLRVVAVSGLTEGGHNGGTYPYVKDWAIKVTGTGNRLSAIKTANDSGNWNVVSQLGKTYQVLSNISVGDLSTSGELIIRDNETVEIGSTTKPRTIVSPHTSNAITIGFMDGSGYLNEGSKLIINSPKANYNSIQGTLTSYNSHIIIRNTFYDFAPLGPVTIKNSYIETILNSMYFQASAGATTIENTTFANSQGSAVLIYRAGNYKNLIFSRSAGVLCGITGITLSNIDFGTSLVVTAGNSSVTTYVKNCGMSNFANQTATTGNNNQIHVIYTLSLSVVDFLGTAITGYSVVATDGAGTVLYNGVWNGDLDIVVFKKVKGTSTPVNTSYNPITIKVSKDGYETETRTIVLDNNSRNQIFRLRHGYPGRDSMGQEFK